jgi:hypothetical protein
MSSEETGTLEASEPRLRQQKRVIFVKQASVRITSTVVVMNRKRFMHRQPGARQEFEDGRELR